jgi:hypothetical protein
MDLKDKYLDRIADALEEQMGVSPKLIGGNVLKPNIYRIADALDPEPTPLQDGTLKNPLARIAEVIESGGFGGVGEKKIVGTGSPKSDIGEDLSIYLDESTGNVFIKYNDRWTYIGLDNNSGTYPKLPDGVIYKRKYALLDTMNENVWIVDDTSRNAKLLVDRKCIAFPVRESRSNDFNNSTVVNDNLSNYYGYIIISNDEFVDNQNVKIGSYVSIRNTLDIFYKDAFVASLNKGVVYLDGMFSDPRYISVSLFDRDSSTFSTKQLLIDDYKDDDINTITRIVKRSDKTQIRIIDDFLYKVFMSVIEV